MFFSYLTDSIGSRIEKKLPNIAPILFYSAFVIFILMQYMYGTLFKVNGHYVFIMMTVSTVLAGIKILLFDKVSDVYKLLMLTTLALLFAAGKNSYDYGLYYYTFLIFAARDIKFEKIAKLFVIVMTTMVFITTVCAVLHVIPTLAVGRSNSDVLRLSLGSVYPTDLASRIFHIVLTYVVLKKFNLNIPEYISLIAVTITTYLVTDTKLSLILMIILIAFCILYPYIGKVFESVKTYVISGLALLFIGINLILPYLYSASNPVLKKLDSLLTGRLYLGNVAFKDYNATLYGQFVYQNGWGGLQNKVVENYFFIDSSIVRVLLMQGMIVYVFLLWLILRNINKTLKNKQYSIVLGLLLVLLSGAIDPHLIEISFNIMFLVSFANLDYFRENGLN